MSKNGHDHWKWESFFSRISSKTEVSKLWPIGQTWPVFVREMFYTAMPILWRTAYSCVGTTVSESSDCTLGIEVIWFPHDGSFPQIHRRSGVPKWRTLPSSILHSILIDSAHLANLLSTFWVIILLSNAQSHIHPFLCLYIIFSFIHKLFE